MNNKGELASLLDTGQQLSSKQWIHILKELGISVDSANALCKDIGVESKTIKSWISWIHNKHGKCPTSVHRFKLAKYAERIIGHYDIPIQFISRGKVVSDDYLQLKLFCQSCDHTAVGKDETGTAIWNAINRIKPDLCACTELTKSSLKQLVSGNPPIYWYSDMGPTRKGYDIVEIFGTSKLIPRDSAQVGSISHCDIHGVFMVTTIQNLKVFMVHCHASTNGITKQTLETFFDLLWSTASGFFPNSQFIVILTGDINTQPSLLFERYQNVYKNGYIFQLICDNNIFTTRTQSSIDNAFVYMDKSSSYTLACSTVHILNNLADYGKEVECRPFSHFGLSINLCFEPV